MTGYRTYVFLAAALLLIVLAGAGIIKLGDLLVDRIIIALLAAAGVFLRAAVGRDNGSK